MTKIIKSMNVKLRKYKWQVIILSDTMIFGVEPYKSKKFKTYMFEHSGISTNEILNDIEVLNNNKNDKNFSNRLLFEIYNSNSIEGNTLTNQDTKLILEENIAPDDCSIKDILECTNLKGAITRYRKLDTLDLDTILSIHSLITYNILEPSKSGRLRNEDVYISGCMFIPPKADKVKDLLNASIAKFNNSNKALVDMFQFKLDFVSIHPFVDGNGRTARLILNALLESSGYPRVIFKANDKKYYYKALEDAQVRYKPESWIRYCALLLKYNLEYLNDVDILK